MRAKTKSLLQHLGIFTGIFLLSVMIVLWVYRGRIDTLLCSIAKSYIEKTSDITIRYSDIKADFSSVEAKNVVITGKKAKLTINDLYIEYDKSILFAKNKISHIGNVALNGFSLTVFSQPDKDGGLEGEPHNRRLLADIIGKFNCLLSLTDGKIIFEGNTRQSIEIVSASLLSSDFNDDFSFNLITGAGGALPNSTFNGIFNPALPGYFKTQAKIDVISYGNHWFLDDVNVDCSWSLDGSFVADIDAKADNAKARLSYQTNIFEDDGSELDLQIQNIVLTQSVAKNKLYISDDLLTALGELWQEFFTENYIAGEFDLLAKFAFKPDSNTPLIDAKVDIKGGEILYSEFPFKLDGLEGEISLNQHNLGVDMKTTIGDEIAIKAAAVIGSTQSGGNDVDVRITSPSLAVDDKLYQALDSGSRRVWKSFSPTGRAQIDYHLFETPDGSIDYELDIYPLGGSICYDNFPYPVDNITGKFTITRSDVILTDMIGSSDDGKLIANGEIKGLSKDTPDVRLNIVCTDIAVDERLIVPLPDYIEDILARFDFNQAYVDFTVDVSGGLSAEQLIYDIKAELSAEQLKHLSSETVFIKPILKAKFLDNRLNVQSFTGSLNNQEVSVVGVFDLLESGEIKYDLGFEAACEEFEKLTEAFDIYDGGEPIISGKVDLQGRIQGVDEEYQYAVSLKCLDADINLGENIGKIKHCKGEIKIDQSTIEYDIEGALAESESVIASSGKLNSSKPYDGVLSLDIKNINSQDVIVPKALQLTGGNITSIYLPLAKLNSGVLKCDAANIRFSNLAIGENVLTDADGYIRCDIEIDAAGEPVINEGFINIAKMKVYGREVERLMAEFEFDMQSGLRMQTTSFAKIYDGEIGGSFKLVNIDQANSYELSLSFYDIDADRLINSGEEDILKEQFDFDGSVSGELFIAGIIGDSQSRSGRLSLDIQNILVEDRTLFDKVLDAILSLRQGHSLQRVRVNAFLKRDTILLDDVILSLPFMLLRGSGDISLDTNQINLQLGAQGTRIIDSNFLSDILFLRAIGKTIARVDVSGDIADPKIEVRTLGIFKR